MSWYILLFSFLWVVDQVEINKIKQSCTQKLIINLRSSQYHKYSFKPKIYPSPLSSINLPLPLLFCDLYATISSWETIHEFFVVAYCFCIDPNLCVLNSAQYVADIWNDTWNRHGGISFPRWVWWTNLCVMVVGGKWMCGERWICGGGSVVEDGCMVGDRCVIWDNEVIGSGGWGVEVSGFRREAGRPDSKQRPRPQLSPVSATGHPDCSRCSRSSRHTSRGRSHSGLLLTHTHTHTHTHTALCWLQWPTLS